MIRGQGINLGMDFRLGRGQQRCDRLPACRHPFNIAIHHHGTPAKGDGRNRRRRVGTNPGQFAQFILGIGENPAMVIDHRHGTGMQIAGTGVIA